MATLAGSNQIAHLVDCVLILESDRESPIKFLRANKNRFGDITEVGMFQHAESGLMEVSDPSGILMDNDGEAVSGAAVTFISEGIRQIPVEIQSLVVPSNLNNPRKQFSGVDFARAQIVCAILDKFCNAKLFNSDVFGSTVSGIRVNDPSSDVALAAAIMSSVKEISVPDSTVFLGEMGLTGQIRGSYMMENKVREASRLGFKTVVLPQSAKSSITKSYGVHLQYIATARDLSEFLTGKSKF